MENSANDNVKLMADITIDTTLVVSHTVTLDLNGHILKYENNTVQGSVITVGSGGVLTIQDSDATASHHFTPDGNGLWVLDEVNGTEMSPAALSQEVMPHMAVACISMMAAN